MSKSSAPQAGTSATEQNNSTSQSTSAVSASPSADSTDSRSADTSEANTESTDSITDITLSDDTRIVTKKDTNAVDLEEGKQYIDISNDYTGVVDLFNYDVAEVKHYKYVRVHFNGHVYLTDGHNYLSGY